MAVLVRVRMIDQGRVRDERRMRMLLARVPVWVYERPRGIVEMSTIAVRVTGRSRLLRGGYGRLLLLCLLLLRLLWVRIGVFARVWLTIVHRQRRPSLHRVRVMEVQGLLRVVISVRLLTESIEVVHGRMVWRMTVLVCDEAGAVHGASGGSRGHRRAQGHGWGEKALAWGDGVRKAGREGRVEFGVCVSGEGVRRLVGVVGAWTWWWRW